MIENVLLSDDGTYYCEAKNDAGKDSQKIDLRNGFIFFLGIQNQNRLKFLEYSNRKALELVL